LAAAALLFAAGSLKLAPDWLVIQTMAREISMSAMTGKPREKRVSSRYA